MTQQPTCGLRNPYLLSQMWTELVWKGTYDEDGGRKAGAFCYIDGMEP